MKSGGHSENPNQTRENTIPSRERRGLIPLDRSGYIQSGFHEEALFAPRSDLLVVPTAALPHWDGPLTQRCSSAVSVSPLALALALDDFRMVANARGPADCAAIMLRFAGGTGCA